MDLLTKVENETKKQPVYPIAPENFIHRPYGHFHKNTKVCFYCEHPLTNHNRTRDHIIPKILGGKLTEKNKVLACTFCNTNKSHRTLNVWKNYLMKMKKPNGKRADRVHVYKHRLTIIKNIWIILRKL